MVQDLHKNAESPIVNRTTYEQILERHKVFIPKTLFLSNNYMLKYKVVTGLCILGDFEVEQKSAIIQEYVSSDPRSLMKYLEWLYELTLSKIPLNLALTKCISEQHEKMYALKMKCRIGTAIIKQFNQLDNKYSELISQQLLDLRPKLVYI